MKDLIIYKTFDEAEALCVRLWDGEKSIAPQGSSRSEKPIKHPTKERYGVKITQSGYYWKARKAVLTKDELKNIKTVGEDWEQERHETTN